MSKTLPILFFSTAIFGLSADPYALVGTFTNTTNPRQSVSADAIITFDKDGNCVLKVFPPLYGSGTCKLNDYDARTGYTEIVSEGALINITASGSAKEDGTITGQYNVESPSTPELPQFGSFQFKVFKGVQQPQQLNDVLNWETVKNGEEEFLIIRDGNTVSIHHKDGKYAGRRAFLGADGNPTVLIEDSGNVSVYRDFKTNAVLYTWVKGTHDGFFVKESEGMSQYLDRFFQPTGWSSILVNQQTVFVHGVEGDAELYDSSLQPLGIRSGKTPAGKLYWSKTNGEITEFFDESFKPLGWYSVQMNGNTYYAQDRGNNTFVFFDANMKELKSPKRSGFWANFGRVAAAMANGFQQGYQQAQQAQAAAAPRNAQTQQSTFVWQQPGLATTNSQSGTYSTNTQQMGNFTHSNTIGPNGYTANSTTLRVGTFDYITGSSSSGSFSGTTQHVGNFDYTHLTTPSGTWNGTSNQVANFTYHNFTGPNGQTVSGTSVRVGDFIYTNLR